MGQKMYDETSVQLIAYAIRNRMGISQTDPPDDYKWTIGEMSDAVLLLPTLEEGQTGVINNSVTTINSTSSYIPAYKFQKDTEAPTTTMSYVNAYLRNATFVGYHSFFGCDRLIDVMLSDDPSSRITIAPSAFSGCEWLQKVTVGDKYVLGELSDLTSTTLITYDLSKNAYGHFVSTEVLTANYNFLDDDVIFNRADSKYYIRSNNAWTVFVPSVTLSIGTGCFSGTHFKHILAIFDGANRGHLTTALTDYNNLFVNSDLKVVMLGTWSGMSTDDLLAVGNGLFKNCVDIKKVWSIQNGQYVDDPCLTIGYICPNMFYACDSLEEISSNVENVDSLNYTFKFCSSLRHVNLPRLKCPNITTTSQGDYTGGCKMDGTFSRNPKSGDTPPSEPKYDSSQLETIYIGDGTGGILIPGTKSGLTATYGPFENFFPNLYSITFNVENIVIRKATSSSSGVYLYGPCDWIPIEVMPILDNYRGTTTTEITSSSTIDQVTVDGELITVTTGNIVQYGARDWIKTETGWEEWGVDGNKHPGIFIRGGSGFEGRRNSFRMDKKETSTSGTTPDGASIKNWKNLLQPIPGTEND